LKCFFRSFYSFTQTNQNKSNKQNNKTMSTKQQVKQVSKVFKPVLKELKTTIKIRVQREKENTKALKMRAKEERERVKEERMRAKENARIAKEERERAKENARIAKEERVREKRKRIHEKETARFEAFNRMIQVGIALHKTHLDGFTTAQFVEKFKQIYGNINAWTGVVNPDHYDGDAGVRSLIYEMSPSSAQHWFKYGMKKNSYQVAPWSFVNKKLADLNHQYEWMVTTAGTGRAKSKGTWKFVFHLSRDNWDNELFGPLPEDDTLLKAINQRKIGKQNKKN
jgi:small-conductance mechanosensitive channel